MPLFLPDYYATTLEHIDWSYFRNAAVKMVLLDIDNTLVPNGAQAADEYARHICQTLTASGLQVCIVSNAQAARAESFARSLKLECLGQAAKPLPQKIRSFLAARGIAAQACLVIGDQVFTDLLLAKFLGAKCILVQSIGGEEGFWLRVKRCLESMLALLGQDPKRAGAAPIIIK